MKLRRKARMAVLQALYEVDVANHPAGEALDRRLQEQPLPTPAEDFARHLMAGVLAHRQQLNVLIKEHAPEWPLDQMAVVDRNILRIAIYELGDASFTHRLRSQSTKPLKWPNRLAATAARASSTACWGH